MQAADALISSRLTYDAATARLDANVNTTARSPLAAAAAIPGATEGAALASLRQDEHSVNLLRQQLALVGHIKSDAERKEQVIEEFRRQLLATEEKNKLLEADLRLKSDELIHVAERLKEKTELLDKMETEHRAALLKIRGDSNMNDQANLRKIGDLTSQVQSLSAQLGASNAEADRFKSKLPALS